MKRSLWIAVAGLTLAFCALLATDALPWLRGDVPWIPLLGRWRWPYGHPRWLWLVPCALGLTLYTAGALRLLRTAPEHHYPVRLVLWTFVGGALLPLLLLTLEGDPIFLLFARSASPVTGGYQVAAARVTDLGDTLRHWPDFVDGYLDAVQLDPPGGVALSPPGLLAAYAADDALLEAVPPLADQTAALIRPQQCQNIAMMAWTNADLGSAAFQMLMPLWAALGIAPLYRLGTLIFDRKRAQLALVLWPLVPGMAIFTPRFNVFFPLITLVVLLGLWLGLLRDRLRWIAVSGFALSVGMLLNLSLVPLGLLAGLTLLGWHLLHRPVQITRLTRDLAVFGLGCASSWLIYWLLGGLSPLDLLRTGFGQHTDLYRPYWPWLLLHPYDMFIFVGLPVAFLAIWRIVRLRHLREQALTPGDLFAGAAALMLLILVLSGTARGETGRVWLFLAPIWLLLAADVLAGFGSRERAGILALQAICLLSMAGFWRANFTGLTPPPPPPAEAAAPSIPAHVIFERDRDRVTLVGMDITTAPDSVTLYLHWRADARVERPYVLTLLSIPPDGSEPESLHWNPDGWNYPPACWVPGREFVDTVTLPTGNTPGGWLYSLAIVDAYTGEQMQASGPDGWTDVQFGIGPVNVPAE